MWSRITLQIFSSQSSASSTTGKEICRGSEVSTTYRGPSPEPPSPPGCPYATRWYPHAESSHSRTCCQPIPSTGQRQPAGLSQAQEWRGQLKRNRHLHHQSETQGLVTSSYLPNSTLNRASKSRHWCLQTASKNPLKFSLLLKRKKAETWHGLRTPVKPCINYLDLISQLRIPESAHFRGQWVLMDNGSVKWLARAFKLFFCVCQLLLVRCHSTRWQGTWRSWPEAMQTGPFKKSTAYPLSHHHSHFCSIIPLCNLRVIFHLKSSKCFLNGGYCYIIIEQGY